MKGAVSISVSYTHLDVYKRQAFTQSINRFPYAQVQHLTHVNVFVCVFNICHPGQVVPSRGEQTVFIVIRDGELVSFFDMRGGVPASEDHFCFGFSYRSICLFAEQLMIRAMAVSYTHLDVYKRQVHDYAAYDSSYIAMIQNYSTESYTGELFAYDGGKELIFIDRDVSSILWLQ